MKTETKYLTPRDQIKVQLIQHEVLMLTQRIAKITAKRDRLMRKREKILVGKGLES